MNDTQLENLTAAEITSDRYLCRTLIPDEPIVVEIRRRLEQVERLQFLLNQAIETLQTIRNSTALSSITPEAVWRIADYALRAIEATHEPEPKRSAKN